MMEVGIGAILGSLLRYNLSKYNQLYSGLGTILANILGCICLIIFVHLSLPHLFFIVGFCGSLTTWSTCCLDIYEKLITQKYKYSLYYTLITFVISIGLLWLWQ